MTERCHRPTDWKFNVRQQFCFAGLVAGTDVEKMAENSEVKNGSYFFSTDEGYLIGDSELTSKRIFKGYVSNATIHGFSRLDASKGKLKAGYWIFSVLLTCGFLIFNAIDVTMTYLRYEKEVDIEIQHQTELQFPAITICNMSPVRKSAVVDLEAKRRRKKRGVRTADECPLGSLDMGDRRCYQMVHMFYMLNVAEAAEQCLIIDPDWHLATAPTPKENANISASISGSTRSWLGLYNKNGSWIWVDGKPLSWTNWAPGEPSGDGTCAYMKDGLWYDSWCGVLLESGICMRYKYQTEREALVISEDMSTLTSLLPHPNTCCCTCCFQNSGSLMDNSCRTCTASSIASANECAGQITSSDSAPVTPPDSTTTTPIPTTTHHPTVPGSIFPERIATREDFQEQEKLSESLAVLPEDHRAKLGTQKSDFILDCQYDGYQCSVGDFFQFQNPTHGNCFIFNSGWKNGSILKRSKQAGRRYGLQLTVNIEQDEYTKNIGDTAGMRLVIHPQSRMPFPEDEGINVSPGHGTSIAMRQVNMIRLPFPYGKCTNPELDHKDINVFEETYPIHYSFAGCQKTCLQQHIVDKCSCVDPFLPLEGNRFKNLDICTILNITQDDCRYSVKADFNERKFECNCPTSCRDTTYSYQVSTTIWPSDVQRDATLKKFKERITSLFNDPKDPEKYKRNLLKAEIYFEEFNYETTRERPSFLPGNFISNLGGLIGLFIGCSIISLFEIGEYLMDMLVFFCLKRRFKRLGANAIGSGGTADPSGALPNKAGEDKVDPALSARDINCDLNALDSLGPDTPPPSYYSYLNDDDDFMEQVNDYLAVQDPDGNQLTQTNHGSTSPSSIPDVEL